MFFVIVPAHFSGNYILKWVFFVQTISADRYDHRRELRLVSLESSSSVEYGNKKDFQFLNTRRNSAVFIHIFCIFDQIFVKFAKIC